MKQIIKMLFIALIANCAVAQDNSNNNSTNKDGNVQLPLNTYNTLINANKDPKDKAPAGYAIGQSSVSVNIKDTRDRTTALISLTTKIEIFEHKWTLVPILPYGAAITSARINGKKIQLVQSAEWLSWSSNKAGIHDLQLRYTIDPQRSDMGYVLPLPIVRASSTAMTVDFPSQQVDMAIIPSSNIRFDKLKDATRAIANIPAVSSVLISWRVATDFPYVMSRAKYVGKLSDGVVTFSAKYDIELFTGESVNIPLIANSVTLNDVLVDNKSATILERDGQFEVALQGRGRHSVVVKFQAQVIQEQGPPTVSFPIPQVPVSEFNLQLTGKKDVSVFASSVANSTSKIHVNNKINNDNTTAVVFLPMAKSVSFSWVDAVPKDVRTKLRANANVYHAISAEEGVLYGQALIDYEITHGETSSLLFYLPSSAQVNRITSPTGGISDWNVNINEVDKQETRKTVTVFLDRSIKENYQLQVFYEQLLQQTEDQHKEAINVPLIRAKNMHRQRGIVALLAGPELALKPIQELDINRVGENQLPAFFRNQISLTIAHTFKYTSQQPRLTVNTIAPVRKQGKYNAQIDTLISLGEVTMRGSASIAMDVKSGAIVDLQLVLPQGINVLNVTGPSIRNHKIVAEDSKQTQQQNQQPIQQLINIEFTQEMTGQFRIEVNYEKILGENISELTIPSIQVSGTEVQHGRIAVEALTAVEVQTALANQLSSLEINELPQQLVLKTTNPILLAFKYVNTETPHELKLSMTRHQELDVQVAAIETANYQTLITNDGLSVTTATFRVRNSRRQFLRLNLPEDSEVWSVFVDGKAEKPALANDSGKSAILIKMLNSVTGFPVVVVYATPIAKMGLLGSISSQLPLPDMVVTHSFWDVFLPIGPNYQEIKSNMTSVIKGRLVNDNPDQLTSLDSLTKIPVGSLLNMQVPKQGIHYSFEKLYANKSDTLAGFEIRYASESGNLMGLLLSIVSVILIWLAIFLLKSRKTKQSIVIATLTIGILGLFVSVGYLRTTTTVPFSVALTGGVLFIIIMFASKIRANKIK